MRHGTFLIIMVVALATLTVGCRPDKKAWLASDVEESATTSVVALSQADEAFRSSSKRGSRLSESDRDKAVAQIGDRVLTLGELEALYNELPDAQRYQFSSPKGMQEFLDYVVDFEAMSAEARASKMWRNPRILMAVKLAMVKEMLRSEAESLVPVSTVTEADILAEYRTHRDRYRAPSRVRLSLFVTEDEAEAEAQREAIIEQGAGDPAATLAAFRESVREHSVDDASKAKDGDVGFVSNADAEGEDAAALPGILRRKGLELESVGALSEVIDVGTRYFVLVQTERSGGELLPVEQAAAAARQRILRERQDKAVEAYVAQLRAAAKVEIHEGALKDFLARRAETSAESGGDSAEK